MSGCSPPPPSTPTHLWSDPQIVNLFTNSQINSLGCFIRVQKLLFIMFCYGLHLQLIVSSAPSCLQEKFWIPTTYTDYISLYLQPWTQSMLWCTLTEGKTQLLGSGWNIIIDCFSNIIIWLWIDWLIKMGKGKGELDDKEKMWKNSLRPLDPGILSDQIKKKKER